MSIEAMKQWREALVCALSDDKPYIDRCKQAIESIDQAIAEAEKQEPVAKVKRNSSGQIYIEWRDGEFAIANLVDANLCTTPQPNVTTSDMRQEPVAKTANQRHEENT
jgi:hypothetical protein